LLNAQKEITELYSELSYDELKGVLESWLNPSANANGAGNPVNEALEAPKTQSSVSTDMGGTTQPPVVDKLPWDEEEIVVTAPAKPAPKAAVAKDDVESAFDDLFNN
jgi:hypothetical protein